MNLRNIAPELWAWGVKQFKCGVSIRKLCGFLQQHHVWMMRAAKTQPVWRY